MAEDRHVRFGENADETSKQNSIIIQNMGNDKLQVHLGFLKYLHVYEITLPIKIGEHLSLDDSNVLSPDESIVSPYCKITNMTLLEEELVISIEFKANKIKLLKETLQLSGMNGKKLLLVFLARVLGKDQGTPMLKDGIHCTGLLPDEESEATDWQGFD